MLVPSVKRLKWSLVMSREMGFLLKKNAEGK